MQKYLVLFLAMTAHAAPLIAQRLAESRVALVPAESARASSFPVAERHDSAVRVGPMVAAGIFAGGAGLAAGAALGYALELPHCGGDAMFCGLFGLAVGGSIGELTMLPLGMHSYGSQSSLGAKMGISLLIAVAGLAGAFYTEGVSALAIPPAQILAILALEHRAAERSARQRNNQETP